MLAWLRAHPYWADALLAVPFVAIAVLTSVSARNFADTGLHEPRGIIDWTVLVVPSLCIALRRRLPVCALLVAALATTAIWLLGLPDYMFATCLLIFSAYLHGRAPLAQRSAIGVAAWLTAFATLGVVAGEIPAFTVAVVGLMVAGAIAVASNALNHRAYLSELEYRAEQSEKLRVAEIEKVATDERTRIARELHDVVAHGLSVIVVQAGAAQRIINSDIDGTTHALGEIEGAARNSLSEMRQVLGLLRTDDADNRRPTPVADALPELVASYQEHGVETTLRISGDRRQLPSTIDTSVYRIVEEALTNVLKHAGPIPRANVSLDYEPDHLVLKVVDNGRGAAAPRQPGHGLIGMRERVDVLGGTITAKPVTGGGFAVKVHLPLEPALQS